MILPDQLQNAPNQSGVQVCGVNRWINRQVRVTVELAYASQVCHLPVTGMFSRIFDFGSRPIYFDSAVFHLGPMAWSCVLLLPGRFR